MLSAENHSWFNKQSPEVQAKLNKAFQDYKKGCNVTFVDDLETPYKIVPLEIQIDEKGKYNRAEKKREDKKLIQEYERGE